MFNVGKCQSLSVCLTFYLNNVEKKSSPSNRLLFKVYFSSLPKSKLTGLLAAFLSALAASFSLAFFSFSSAFSLFV